MLQITEITYMPHSQVLNINQDVRSEHVDNSDSCVLFAAVAEVEGSHFVSQQSTYCVCLALTCFSVSSLVGDLVDGIKQTLFVTVGVQLELSPSVVTELGDGHLPGPGIMSIKLPISFISYTLLGLGDF